MTTSPKRTADPLEVIKGLSIMVFMVNHFRIICWGADLNRESYGRAAVGMFFLASGLAIQRSLSRRLPGAPRFFGPIMRFWRDRALRIYPLYLLAMALMPVLFGASLTWWQVLGANSPYWFFNRIAQCYLAAPLLYFAARSRSWNVRLVPVAFYAALNLGLLAGRYDLSSFWLGQFRYQHLAFTHLLLYYLGMLEAEAGLNWARLAAPLGGLGLLAGYVLMLIACGFGSSPWLHGVAVLVYIPASLIFFASFRALKAPMPGGPVLAFLGRYSWPVCLFEPVYYFALFKLKLLQVLAWKGIVRFVALSPLFFLGCAGLQKAQSLVIRQVAAGPVRLDPQGLSLRSGLKRAGQA